MLLFLGMGWMKWTGRHAGTLVSIEIEERASQVMQSERVLLENIIM